MRGEYGIIRITGHEGLELPPHARRILALTNNLIGVFGTTSACAENTPTRPAQNIRPRNYLRMRGEYLRLMQYRKALLELPPHARRIPEDFTTETAETGTTSACAENTCGNSNPISHQRNYLRMRGEYDIFRALATGATELPPHARRIPLDN